MPFNSYAFVVFLGAVLTLSRVIKDWRARKTILLISSYAFYAAWNPPFVLLLWISTGVDWFVAQRIHTSQDPKRRRLLLIVSLLVNLGMLAYFKYSGFLIGNLNSLLSSMGVALPIPEPNIILPVGISFYTFQTLSYTIDVYRNRLQPWHSFLDYALYVTFFPQLVAGPIVRADVFLPQCVEPRRASRDQLGWGLSLFIIGIFLKVVLADHLAAPIVDKVFDSPLHAGFVTAWAGSLAFSIQIFSDFFGYTTCAIGVALCLGFSLPDNFRYPYAAVGFSDFWRRWHISLSTWLRDYLYIPLGGNRRGRVRTHVNLLVTMLLGGLWHGASWGFVLWGGLHGLFLVAERALQKTRLGKARIWSTGPAQVVLSLGTFGLVTYAWTFFRAQSLSRALSLGRDMLHVASGWRTLRSMLDPSEAFHSFGEISLGLSTYALVLVCVGGLLAVHHLLKESSLETFFGKLHWVARAGLLALMAYLSILSMTGVDRAFIYFQF